MKIKKTLPHKIALTFILIIFMSFGCKKETPKDPIVIDTTLETGYLPLAVGNYWHYDVYKVVDSLGSQSEEALNYIDTTRIIAEEVVNGITYFVIEQDSWLTQTNKKDTVFYRDSSGYIVNLAGDILFSSTDFNTILHQIDYTPATYLAEYSVSDTAETHTVPSGTYECLNYKGRVINTNPNNTNPDRFVHNCYSEKVGVVFQTIFFASQYDVHYERRLSDFYIE